MLFTTIASCRTTEPCGTKKWRVTSTGKALLLALRATDACSRSSNAGRLHFAQQRIASLRPAHCKPLLAQVASTKAPTAPAGAHLSALSRTSPQDDIVVVAAVRTALCKAKVGGFKDTTVDDLMTAVLKELMKRTGVKPEEVGDICMGSGLGSASKRANEARQAEFAAGFPPAVPVRTVNRQCAAGLESIADVAAAIHAGYYEVGIAGGMETMSTDSLEWDGSHNPHLEGVKDAQDCLVPMGITSDNVAFQFHVPREAQDALAAASHAKAAAAQAAGRFKEEIVPVETVLRDPKTGEEKTVVIDQDDGIRPDFTVQKLARMHPCFQKGGTTTAGNACQTTDGAAAVMLMTRREAQRRGLPVLAALRSYTSVGVPPAVMGIGPAVAIPKALERAGLTKDDIDVFEINEAFASQAAYCTQALGLDESKVNPNGGAIALGHPIGCTGARQTVTLLHEMQRMEGVRYGVVSMCVGSGMGAAAVFEVDRGDGKAEGAK